MDENQIHLAGDDVDLPEDLQKMVDEDQEEEEDKDSILGQLQNLQNMDLDTIKEKAQATFTEIRQTAEQKCSVMWGTGQAWWREPGQGGGALSPSGRFEKIYINVVNTLRKTMMINALQTGSQQLDILNAPGRAFS